MLNGFRKVVIPVSTCLMIFLCASTAAPGFTSPDEAATKAKVTPDPRIGKKVIVTKASAPLRTPEKIVWKAYLGETFTVSLTNGEWLWIAEKGGWLWEKEIIMFDNAIAELTQRIKAEPIAKNFQLRGIAYSAHGQYDKAISDYTESLKASPASAGVLNNRGQAHYLKQDVEAAIIDFTAAITADPKHYLAMNNRALCHIAKGDHATALADLNAAIAANKDYPEALNNRGVVHANQGNFKEAIADYSAAIRIDEKYVDAYGNRSHAYRQQERYAEAVADLRTAIGKSPTDYSPVNDLAWVLATVTDDSTRNPAEAVALATKACQMTQYEDWNTLDTLATAYAAMGDFKSAHLWITTAVEKAPEINKPGLSEHIQLIQAGQPIVK